MHLNMSHSEVKMLPIRYRNWYLNRLARHFEEKNKLHESVKNNGNNNNHGNLDKFAQFESQINNKLK